MYVMSESVNSVPSAADTLKGTALSIVLPSTSGKLPAIIATAAKIETIFFAFI